MAAFYQENLVADDWGRVTKPKDEGSKTTSVSVMKASGVKKMCRNWIAVIDDERYVSLLSKKKWIGYRVDGTDGDKPKQRLAPDSRKKLQ